MFDQSALWEEIGYHVKAGSLEDGKRVVLERTSKSSPEFLESHSDIDDLIMFKQFDSKEEQDRWVANEIQTNLTEDELRPDDIIVINPNPVTTKSNVASIRALLYEKGIQSHTAGVDTAPDVFFDEDNASVAFTEFTGQRETKRPWSISSMPKRALTHFLIWQNFEISCLPRLLEARHG